MKFSHSLKLNHIFRRLYSSSGHANGYLVLYARKNRSESNRVRRRIREAYRLNEEKFAPGYDIVVVARTRAISCPFADLTRAYLSLAAKAGILLKDDNHEKIDA